MNGEVKTSDMHINTGVSVMRVDRQFKVSAAGTPSSVRAAYACYLQA